jgi:hypothetical protein
VLFRSLAVLESIQKAPPCSQPPAYPTRRLDSIGVRPHSVMTLRMRPKKLVENPKSRPCYTNWGKHRRIFADAEEAAIADMICANYITSHHLFTGENFITLAVDRIPPTMTIPCD